MNEDEIQFDENIDEDLGQITVGSDMRVHYGLSGLLALDIDPVLLSSELSWLLKTKTMAWSLTLGYKF